MSVPALLLAGACSDVDAARAAARELGAAVYGDDRGSVSGLPFRALLLAATDRPERLRDVADVGRYVVYRRVIRPGPAAVYGLFPLVRRADLSRAEADAHWRDVHAPLALEHHAAMSDYVQLAVVEQLAGTAFDGFALCGFPSVDDLRQRFFSTPASRDVIAGDVRKFADVAGSARRLIATATRFGDVGW